MKYDLVFEGGGAKGIVFAGALQVFEAQGHTYGRLLGTSAGAITAALLAAGYTAEEMLAALAEKKDGHSVFADFMGTPAPFEKAAIQASATRKFLRQFNLPLVPDRLEEKLDDYLAEWIATLPGLRHVFSFIERGGWFAADNFLSWLQRRLDTGTFKGKPRCFSGLTLVQYYDATQVDLSLVASDTLAAQMLVLNHRTAPDLPLVWAVRMSMSIPLVWQEVIWQVEWGQYHGQEMTRHTIVDGGLLSNFPLELFVSEDRMVTSVMGPKTSDHILGLLIDETLTVSGAERAGKEDATLNIGELQTVKRLSNLLNTMMRAHDKMVIDVFADLVVHLPAQGYTTTEFDMSDERREWLVNAGQDAMTGYFEHVSKARVLKSDEEVERAQHTADRFALRILGG
jgi:NTE family protein